MLKSVRSVFKCDLSEITLFLLDSVGEKGGNCCPGIVSVCKDSINSMLEHFQGKLCI